MTAASGPQQLDKVVDGVNLSEIERRWAAGDRALLANAIPGLIRAVRSLAAPSAQPDEERPARRLAEAVRAALTPGPDLLPASGTRAELVAALAAYDATPPPSLSQQRRRTEQDGEEPGRLQTDRLRDMNREAHAEMRANGGVLSADTAARWNAAYADSLHPRPARPRHRGGATVSADDTVLVEPVEYRVVAAEIADDPEADSWTVKVAWRGDGRWAVILRSCCWNRRTKTWDYELRPSARTAAFLRTHRFDLDTALAIARQQAPLVVVNGMTPADLAAFRARQQ